jgi:starch-binding outer membrane protein, SusD/RagB family
MKTITTVLITALMVAACDLDVPDLNNPSIDQLDENPTRVNVSAACTGLIMGNRRNVAAGNGYIIQLGILGREAYNFDQADPRYIGELLQGTLNKGSPFGGNFWGLPYTNIRLANTIQGAVDKVADFTPEERKGILGFSKTIEALDLLEVANTRDTNGGVIDTDKPVDQLGAIVGKDMMFAEIAKQLDEGATDLDGAGMKFAFQLSSGYTGFNTPASFKKFNRAIRARVAVYMKDYTTALTALGASFLNEMPMTAAGLNTGVYHTFSTGPGDVTNGLVNPNIFAHPSLATDAQPNDARLANKTEKADEGGGAQGLSSELVFEMYDSPSSPVPIIRNEELLLLLAEARWFTGDESGALTALNTVRQLSGGLSAVNGITTEAAFVDALLYERRYSLMFEGHRWIDLRRFNKPLPLDNPEHKQNIRYPLPLTECNARPNEPACMLGST